MAGKATTLTERIAVVEARQEAALAREETMVESMALRVEIALERGIAKAVATLASAADVATLKTTVGQLEDRIAAAEARREGRGDVFRWVGTVAGYAREWGPYIAIAGVAAMNFFR